MLKQLAKPIWHAFWVMWQITNPTLTWCILFPVDKLPSKTLWKHHNCATYIFSIDVKDTVWRSQWLWWNTWLFPVSCSESFVRMRLSARLLEPAAWTTWSRNPTDQDMLKFDHLLSYLGKQLQHQLRAQTHSWVAGKRCRQVTLEFQTNPILGFKQHLT